MNISPYIDQNTVNSLVGMFTLEELILIKTGLDAQLPGISLSVPPKPGLSPMALVGLYERFMRWHTLVSIITEAIDYLQE